MSGNRKRVFAVLLLAALPVVGLVAYYFWLVYQPFSSRTIAPKNLVAEYDGPGSLRRTSQPPAEPAGEDGR